MYVVAIKYSHRNIVGPFETSADAHEYLQKKCEEFHRASDDPKREAWAINFDTPTYTDETRSGTIKGEARMKDRWVDTTYVVVELKKP